MKTEIALEKDSLIKAITMANKELYDYIQNDLTSEDLTYSNTIGFGGDNSLNIDLKAEKMFIKHLSEYGNIYSEECGLLSDDKELTFIIDPIDGSNNFLSSLPYYGTSIAIKKGDEYIAGFITNLISAVMTYKIFDSEIIKIDIRDFKKVTKTTSDNLKLAVFESAYDYPKICEEFSKNRIKYRSLGSTALSLCDAKNYKFVLYFGNIREFDVAAALYINSELFIQKSEKYLLISKNYEIFSQIKELLKNIRL